MRYCLSTLFIIGLISTSILGCDKVTDLSSPGSQSSKAASDEFNPALAKYRVFSFANSTEVYAGEIEVDGRQLAIPQSLINGLYGDRTSLYDNQNIDLIVKGFLLSSQSYSGDFYFETPIVGPEADVNSINTALTIIMRTAVSPTPRFSRKSWIRIVKTIELACPNCLQSSFSNVIQSIKGKPEVVNEILSAMSIENSGSSFNLDWSKIPTYLVAWSSPIIEGSETSSLEVTEGLLVVNYLTLVSTAESTLRIAPTSWELLREASPRSGTFISALSGSSTEEFSAYLENGWSQRETVQIKIVARNDRPTAQANEYQFKYQLNFSNRPPLYSSLKTVNFKMNHYSEIDLETEGVAIDPDGTELTFQCVQCPIGMITNGTKIGWAPTLDNAQIGTQNITLKAVDADRSAELGQVVINVMPDSAPEILSVEINNVVSAENSTVIMNENSLYHLKIIATDADIEDVLLIDTQALISNGLLLDGNVERGELSHIGLRNLQTTKVGSNYEITFDFTPSFFQVEDIANDTFPLVLEVNYNTAITNTEGKPVLTSLKDPAKFELNLNIQNIDDAPVFFKGNTDPYYTGPFITNSYDNVSDQNNGPLISQGVASSVKIDVASLADFHSPGSAITYSINDFVEVRGPNDSLMADCGSGTLSTNIFTWTPPYTAPIEGGCALYLTAINTNGLITNSQVPVTLQITKQNLAPINTADAGLIQMFEGNDSANTKALDLYLSDPNLDLLSYSLLCDLGAPQPSGNTFVSSCPTNLPTIAAANISWTPSFNMGTDDPNLVYPFKLEGTDPDGLSAVRYIYINVKNKPAEPIVILSSAINATENSSTGFSVTVQPYRADGSTIDTIDQYNYSISILCDGGTSGIGPKIVSPTSSNGNTADGNQVFTYGINLIGDFLRGNGALGYKDYSCNLSVDHNDDLTVNFPTSYTIAIRVNNLNRIPTGITASYYSNMSAPTTTFNFDYTNSPKLKAVMYIKITDADGVNDIYTLTGPTFGGAAKVESTTTKGVYKYTIDFGALNLLCLSSGTSTIEKKTSAFTFTYKDAETSPKNATNLVLKINKVKPGTCF